MHTLVVRVYVLACHAHVSTCACIRAIDLVHGFVNMHAAQPSVWHFSALVLSAVDINERLNHAIQLVSLNDN